MWNLCQKSHSEAQGVCVVCVTSSGSVTLRGVFEDKMKGGEHFPSLIKGRAVSVVGVLSIGWLAGDLLSLLCYQDKPH